MLKHVIKEAPRGAITKTQLANDLFNEYNNAVIGISKFHGIYKLMRNDKMQFMWTAITKTHGAFKFPNETDSIKDVLNQMDEICIIETANDLIEAINYLKSIESLL